MAKKKTVGGAPKYGAFEHPEARSPMRPDVGTQAAFKKKKPPATYRYDSSLSPALDWDGQNPAREQGEAILAAVAAQLAQIHVALNDPGLDGVLRDRLSASASECTTLIERLKAMSRPFLNWAGKAERLSFDVPTLPLFVHERLSTKAIVETLGGHKRNQSTQKTMFDLFGDPHHSIADQITRAYEYKDGWVNRMILGDSLVAMNSLLHFENLGGQVQMIYMDPPYGIKFGSNFQPFVRKRDVSHGDDEDMTREPEMVQAYRDTWELGLHSYLTYFRDRILLCREIMAESGSIFVQISDENLHHVREVMDEVFGAENFLVTIFMRKKGSQRGNDVKPINDHLLWYAKNKPRMKRRFVYSAKLDTFDLADEFDYIELGTGETKPITEYEPEELAQLIDQGAKLYVPEPLTSGGEFRTQLYNVVYNGRTFRPPPNNCWKFSEDGMNRIISEGRLHVGKNQIRFKKYHTDFPFQAISNMWSDLAGASGKVYAVQTSLKALQRCILMTTDPGDLVLDPTCGSGTTAYAAEQWGRRWITIDTSRVPLALTRQRLLTATYPFYQLFDDKRGPAGGFIYTRKQNNRGAVGGIVSHTTSTSIANNDFPVEEVLVDRPDVQPSVTRVSGPFTVEATIPPPVEMNDNPGDEEAIGGVKDGKFSDRMLEVLRKSPVLRLEGNRTVTFKNVRLPAKALTLSAEAIQTGDEDQAVAFVFGPENGAVTETLVHQALREANMKGYIHLYVIGFAIQPNARKLIDDAVAMGVPSTYVQATPDLMMGDLLKNLRSSQIFSVCGLPEVEVHPTKDGKHEVSLIGLDVFDPITLDVEHRRGDDVPAWFLDTDYNNLCFHVCQAFFPRTSAWENLKKALKGTYDDDVWDHLSGTTSTPFEAGEHRQIAVKVIDDRGNELLVVKSLGT